MYEERKFASAGLKFSSQQLKLTDKGPTKFKISNTKIYL